jgi:hypothetical protein
VAGTVRSTKDGVECLGSEGTTAVLRGRRGGVLGVGHGDDGKGFDC